MRFTRAVCLSIVKILDIKRKKAREAGLFLCISFAILGVICYLAISCFIDSSNNLHGWAFLLSVLKRMLKILFLH